MIEAQFGQPGIALRTLELYTVGTLQATLKPPSPPSAEWREVMDTLSEIACNKYALTRFHFLIIIFYIDIVRLCTTRSLCHISGRLHQLENWASLILEAGQLNEGQKEELKVYVLFLGYFLLHKFVEQ